jgi:uncharacterized protein YgbK (DUF1537 family)
LTLPEGRANVSAMMVGIQADDLTGACDTAAPFAVRGLETLVIVQDPDGRTSAAGAGADVLAIDTETRERSSEVAREMAHRAGAALRAAAPAVLYKKVDSTLRGRIAAELDGMLEGVGVVTTLLAPAFPAQGRTVLDGRLLVDGRPVEETPIALDPTAPATGASVLALLATADTRPAGLLPLATLRRGREAVDARIERFSASGGRALVADAETAPDLAVLADAGRGRPLLLAGSAGLATALARREACAVTGRREPLRGPLLVVTGSAHPSTRTQVMRLGRRDGLEVLAPPDDGRAADPARRTGITRSLAESARARIERERPGAVLLTGGETAIAVLRALGAAGLRLTGLLEPGLALGALAGGPFDGLAVLTKAGGFGDADALVRVWKACA